jgi:hypothetical protein
MSKKTSLDARNAGLKSGEAMRSRSVSKSERSAPEWLALCLALITNAFAMTVAAPMAVFGADSSLPSAVRADILRNQIVADIKANNLQDALNAIDSYKKLKVPFPTPLWLVEAKAAYATGDKIRAKTALEAFLSHVDRSSSAYQEALALYPTYDKAAEPLIAKAAEEKQAAHLQAVAKLQADRRRAAAVRRVTLQKLLAEPLDCTSKVKQRSEKGFTSTPDLVESQDTSIGFQTGKDSVAYEFDSRKALKPLGPTLHWTLVHSGHYSGSIRVELMARPDAFDGSLTGTKVLSVRPTFSGNGAYSNNQVEGDYTWSLTSTEYLNGASLPMGKYCVVALLEEFHSGVCARNDFFCVVDWVPFKDPVVIQ